MVLIRELKLVFMIREFSRDFLDAIHNNLCFEDSVSLESEWSLYYKALSYQNMVSFIN